MSDSNRDRRIEEFINSIKSSISELDLCPKKEKKIIHYLNKDGDFILIKNLRDDELQDAIKLALERSNNEWQKFQNTLKYLQKCYDLSLQFSTILNELEDELGRRNNIKETANQTKELKTND